jgi:hypothetical protein
LGPPRWIPDAVGWRLVLQASAQVPLLSRRPRFSSLRRFRPAIRRCSQALGRICQDVSVLGWNAVSVSPYRHAAFHRRSNVKASAVSRSESPCKACSTSTEPITERRNRRPAPPRREEVLHHGIRKQPPPMCGQKSEDTARGQQLTGQRLHIQKPALGVLTSLHRTSLDHQPHRSSRRARRGDYFSGLLADPGPSGLPPFIRESAQCRHLISGAFPAQPSLGGLHSNSLNARPVLILNTRSRCTILHVYDLHHTSGVPRK